MSALPSRRSSANKVADALGKIVCKGHSFSRKRCCQRGGNILLAVAAQFIILKILNDFRLLITSSSPWASPLKEKVCSLRETWIAWYHFLHHDTLQCS